MPGKTLRSADETFEGWSRDHAERFHPRPVRWMVATGLLALVMTLLCTPWSRAALGVDVRGAAIASVAAFSLGSVASAIARAMKRRGPSWTILTLAGSASAVFAGASMVAALRGTLAAEILAPLLFAAVAREAKLHHASLRTPYPAAAWVFGFGAALILSSTAAAALVLGSLATAAIGFALFIGTWLVRAEQTAKETERYREALAAQVLLEQTAPDREEGARRKERHAINNELQVLISGLSLVRDGLAGAQIDRGDLTGIVSEVERGVVRIARAVDKGARREAGERISEVDVPPPVEVALAHTLDGVIADAAARYPKIAIRGETHGAVSVAMRGGEIVLRRVLRDLIANACEGDGRARPTEVRVAVRREASEVVIDIRDDGPGFPPGALEDPPRPLASTKKSGVGVGLFTVDRLVRASGGTLARENADPKGALVRVALPPAALAHMPKG